MAEKLQIIIDVEGGKATTTLKDVEGGLKKVGKEAGHASGKLSKLPNDFSGIAQEALKAAAAFAVLSKVMGSGLKAAKEYEANMTALGVAARFAGENVDGTLNRALELAEDGLLTNAEAAKALQNLLLRGFGLEEATVLLGRFKDSAAFGRQASLSFGDAIVSATEGLKNENSILVDNAGVTKNVSVMWAEYAKTLGKGVKALSLAEKRQAELNGIMAETEAMAGNAERALNGLMGAEARLRKATNDLERSFGETLTPAFIELNEAATFTLNEVLKPMLFLFGATGIEAAELATDVGLLFDFLEGEHDQAALDRMREGLKRNSELAQQLKTELAASFETGKRPDIGADGGGRRTEETADAEVDKERQKLERLLTARNAYFQNLQALTDAAGGSAEEKAIAAEEVRFNRELATQRSLHQALWDSDKLSEDERIKLKEDSLIARDNLQKKHDAKLASIEQASARAKMGVAKSVFGGLSALMNTENRKLFEIGKAAAVANSIVSTLEGAQSAFTGTVKALGGGPWAIAAGAVAAAAVAAAGYARVQAITSTTMGSSGAGVASGGGVPNVGGNGSVPRSSVPTAPEQQGAATINVNIEGGAVLDSNFATDLAEQLAEPMQRAFGKNLQHTVNV